MDKASRRLFYEVMAADAILGDRGPEEATEEEVREIIQITEAVEEIREKRKGEKNER